jgi:hypothetical protein
MLIRWFEMMLGRWLVGETCFREAKDASLVPTAAFGLFQRLGDQAACIPPTA